MPTRLIQFANEDGASRAAQVQDGRRVQELDGVESLYQLAQDAIARGISLTQAVADKANGPVHDYQALIDSRRLLTPVQHPDPAHLLISGTGLSHLGSADTRDSMHAKLQGNPDDLTDSMKMFRMGLEGGKPAKGQMGVQPEWFYKGDGGMLIAPEQPLTSPAFALDGGEEPEICGVYLIGPDRRPYRLGFALGNEFSDHKMERINYLYLAHSKLRPCSIGPELRLGPLPANIEGSSRIRRDGDVVWEKPFLSGEDNMCHSIDNLEAHHFKYQQFLRPDDVHIHFFGTATLSFGDGFETREGDVFEIEAPDFGRPLRNSLRQAKEESTRVVALE